MARIPKKLPRDVNSRAVAIARIAVGEDEENVDRRPIGKIATTKGRASKGGSGRASALAPGRRSQIAKAAAARRWQKKTKQP